MFNRKSATSTRTSTSSTYKRQKKENPTSSSSTEIASTEISQGKLELALAKAQRPTECLNPKSKAKSRATRNIKCNTKQQLEDSESVGQDPDP